MARSLQPLTNRYFILNFFEKPTDEEGYQTKWREQAGYMMSVDHFISTYLHRSTDPDSRFPWVNFAVYSSDDVCCFGKPDPRWEELTIKAKVKFARGFPAGYRELASLEGKELVEDDKSSGETSSFFLTGVKVKDEISDEEFEAKWGERSGASMLKEKVGKDKYKDSILYKRFTTKMSPIFRYCVRTEVEDMAEASGHVITKEMNGRTFPDGIETITGFYKVAITYKKQ